MITKKVVAVVRSAENNRSKEFVILAEIGVDYQDACNREDITRASLPGWHAANPVRRVSEFDLVERSNHS